MKCSLTCFYCQTTDIYTLEDNFCFNCQQRILDEKIKPLVFALNLFGIETERSCEGHLGFDCGLYNFPWIVITHQEDHIALEEVVDLYNSAGFPAWEVSFLITSNRYFLSPKIKHKDLKVLHQEAQCLARFIARLVKKLQAV